MWTLDFWKSAIERSVKTFAQSLLAVIGGNQLDVINVDWSSALSIAIGAALLSVLTSLGSAKLTDGNPSLV